MHHALHVLYASGNCCIHFGRVVLEAAHKVRHATFGQFKPPLPLSHFVTHPGTSPESTSHISDPPIFSRPSTKAPCTNSLSIVRGSSGRFCSGWFLSIPPYVRIHLLQQKGKHHFKFHVSYV